jgi:uncharacterized DUF497 family protein
MATISFDLAKSSKNVAERGIAFELAERFDWRAALVVEDDRMDHGEHRFRALGPIDGRLYALVFTPRAGKVHVISLRKANRRETKRYTAAHGNR